MTPATRAEGATPATAVAEYAASREGAVLIDRSGIGRLAIRGRDALDLLHRLTTNAVLGLEPGEGTVTVFTTAKGRILDLVTLQCLEDLIVCLTSPGQAPAISAWIDRYTFREEVAVEDQTDSHGTLGLFGPQASALIGDLFGDEAAGRPPHYPTRVELEGSPAVLTRTFPLGGCGYLITTARSALGGLRSAMLNKGAGRVVPAGDRCFELLRIEAGLPAGGRELTEEHNPWEARLSDAISLEKGCYVGQEVIARLNTYKKVSKFLVRLRVEGSDEPAPGTPLCHQGKAVGSVTSSARVPGTDHVLALGYVRDEDAVTGREIEIGSGTGTAARIEGLAR